jgi:ribonucleases P/MRP protein subunit RPP40
MTFLDKVTGCIDRGDSVDAIFFDLAKAFDKVPHQRLLAKVKAHGITGRLYEWVQHWLLGRRQCVCIDGTQSDWLKIMSGVPQGSVLGPVLFLIYINDLDCTLTNWILKFADDTKLFGIANDTAACQGIQADVDKLVS